MRITAAEGMKHSFPPDSQFANPSTRRSFIWRVLQNILSSLLAVSAVVLENLCGVNQPGSFNCGGGD